MRLLFITDIHGNCGAMLQLFIAAGLEPTTDVLVVGGDMIDRGPDSGKVLQDVRLLQQAYPQNIHVLLGNHEQMMLDFYWKHDPMWKKYGGNESQMSFQQVFQGSALESYLDWLNERPIVYETDDYIFTHAGINPDYPLHQQSRDVLWMNQNEFNKNVAEASLHNITNGRVVVHGHTPHSTIQFNGVRLNCDLGSGVFPSRYAALALVDLTHQKYYRYSFQHHAVRLHHIKDNPDPA